MLACPRPRFSKSLRSGTILPMTHDDRTSAFAAFGVRLAAVFIAAGALFKLFGSPNDIPPIVHEIVGDKLLAYRLAITIELGVAALGLLWPRIGWPLVAATFVAFDAVLVVLIAEGTESCGCFGKRLKIDPSTMLAIDTALLVLTLALRPWRSARRPLVHPALVGLALVAALATPWIVDRQVTTLVANGDAGANGGARPKPSGYALLSPEEWAGKRIDQTELANGYLDVYSLPQDGTWVFYRQDCGHCADHMQTLWENPDPTRPLVLIRVPQAHDAPENDVIVFRPEGPHVVETQLAGGVDYVLTTPADLELAGGVVTAARHPLETETD